MAIVWWGIRREKGFSGWEEILSSGFGSCSHGLGRGGCWSFTDGILGCPEADHQWSRHSEIPS